MLFFCYANFYNITEISLIKVMPYMGKLKSNNSSQWLDL